MGWQHNLSHCSACSLSYAQQPSGILHEITLSFMFFMLSSHQEISHEITLSVMFFKTISIFIWLTYTYYFPNVLECVFSTSVASSSILPHPLHIFIIKLLANSNVAHFNNKSERHCWNTLGNKERETGDTEMCEDSGQGLANSPCPWTRGPALSPAVTCKPLARTFTFSNSMNEMGHNVQFHFSCVAVCI